MNKAILIGIVAVLGTAVVVLALLDTAFDPTDDASAGAALIEVTIPELSAQAIAGEAAFAANCASCHGQNAAGVKGAGPPLVHAIYEPGHHADMAFHMAATRGVRAHHWRFGDMPPVPAVTQTDVTEIITYVRALQRANGIK